MRPTTRSVAVCPMPQKIPISKDRRRLRLSLTMVETATTCSASMACSIPKKTPKAINVTKLAGYSSFSEEVNPVGEHSGAKAIVNVHDCRTGRAGIEHG